MGELQVKISKICTKVTKHILCLWLEPSGGQGEQIFIFPWEVTSRNFFKIGLSPLLLELL